MKDFLEVFKFMQTLRPIELISFIVLLFIIIDSGFGNKITDKLFPFIRKRKEREFDQKRDGILKVLASVVKNTAVEAKIFWHDTVKEQMNDVDVALNQIRSKCRSNYLALLKKHLKTEVGLTNHFDFKYYNNIIKGVLRDDIKTEIRKAIIEDKFTEKKDAEFELYLNKKIDEIMGFMSQLIDDQYPDDTKVAIIRIVLYKSTHEVDLFIKDRLKNTFTNARKVAFKKRSEIAKLKAENELKIESIFKRK